MISTGIYNLFILKDTYQFNIETLIALKDLLDCQTVRQKSQHVANWTYKRLIVNHIYIVTTDA